MRPCFQHSSVVFGSTRNGVVRGNKEKAETTFETISADSCGGAFASCEAIIQYPPAMSPISNGLVFHVCRLLRKLLRVFSVLDPLHTHLHHNILYLGFLWYLRCFRFGSTLAQNVCVQRPMERSDDTEMPDLFVRNTPGYAIVRLERCALP